MIFKQKKFKAVILIVSVVLLTVTLVFLKFKGIIFGNDPSKLIYSVRGVDVSEYQGVIDWKKIKDQGISFAYIKATEGSGYVDHRFQYNFSNCDKAGIKTGAYHFFSFESKSLMQADNFIDTVGKRKDMLPPVLDVELYGNYIYNPPEKSVLLDAVQVFCEEIEKYYNVKPVIYTTQYVYNKYFKNKIDDYDIWICNISSTPDFEDDRDWAFWQYSHTEKLEGYDGDEKYIDMNVFNGSFKEFERYCGANLINMEL